MIAFATLALGLVSSVIAANISVSAGTSDDKNIFVPTSVTASSGDTIVFTFFDPGAHTATQSTFAAPCSSLSGGVDSGLMLTNGSQFTYSVVSSDPVWFYCATGTHCKQGMVFAVNPTSSQTFETFQGVAQGLIQAPGSSSVASPSPTAASASGSSAQSKSSSPVSSTSASASASASGAANVIQAGALGWVAAVGALAALL